MYDYLVEVETDTGLTIEAMVDSVSVIEVVVDADPQIEVIEEGPQGIPGPPGEGFIHNQSSPAAEWTVTHNLGRKVIPTLVLTSAPSEPVFTDVVFIDSNSFLVQWTQPESGWAFI